MTRSKTLTIGAALLATVAIPALAVAHGGGDRDGGAPPRAERMIERFQAMDTDKDGTVTPDEFTAHRAERFKAADKDGDGLLNAEELAAMHEGRGPATKTQRMVAWLDRDGDGKLSQEEVAGMGGPMMAMLDRDGNGSVDKIELGRMLERMERHHGRMGGMMGGHQGGGRH